MSTVNLSARVPPRELAIVAYHAGMTDASVSEIGKYAMLRLAGYSHDEAKEKALALRGRHTIDDADRVIGIRMQTEWIDEARSHAPDIGDNTSLLFRYSLARLVSGSDEARTIASRRMGRPPKISDVA
jgi:hypothetical protein